jgi:hypothetical protein
MVKRFEDLHLTGVFGPFHGVQYIHRGEMVVMFAACVASGNSLLFDGFK